MSVDTPHAIYFSESTKRGSKDFCMSASALKAFDVCPSRWVKGWNPPESEAKLRGSILDVRLLTPKQFDQRFSVQPAKYVTDGMQCPQCKSITDSQKCAKCKCERVKVNVEKDWSNQSATCQEWVAEQEKSGAEVITAKDVSEADTAIERLKSNEIVSAFLECSQKQVMLQAEWHDPKTGLIIPLRCMMDLVPNGDSEFSSCLGDLKRVWNGNPASWMFDAEKNGAHIQASFYTDLMNGIEGNHRDTFCFIASESFEPYETSLMMMTDGEGEKFIEMGRYAYRRMLANYCHCLASGEWPGYNHSGVQGWTPLRPTQKMVEKELDKPRFGDLEGITQEEVEANTETEAFDTTP